MDGYAVALFVHLLSLLFAAGATTLTFFAAVRLRDAETAAEAEAWMALTARVVRVFPVAALGLVGTGAYMAHQRWSLTLPWVDAAIAGLCLILILGMGVDRSRGRALERALRSSGLSPRTRRLLHDPVGWTARTTSLGVLVAVVFVMTVKPMAAGSLAALAAAVVGGGLAAVPMWRSSRAGAGGEAARGGRPSAA